MLRITIPGGRITICHTSAREKLNRMHQSIGGVVGNDLLPDDETMMTLFSQAGFADIVITGQANRYIPNARRP